MNSHFNSHLGTEHAISRIPLNLVDPYLFIIKNSIMPLLNMLLDNANAVRINEILRGTAFRKQSNSVL